MCLLDALPANLIDQVGCYINRSHQIEMIQIEDNPNGYFERVVFQVSGWCLKGYQKLT
ncbi:DUF1830 domain-containing protein [Flavobacterium sp. CLA17]|uniref:DUF1830 domain-containing protein n=1 Tax=Leptolyngbya sp. Cla-17 TaxID=2803751 RepID=UPI001490C289